MGSGTSALASFVAASANSASVASLGARTRTQLRRRGQLPGAHARLKGARTRSSSAPAAGVEVRDALQEFRLAFRAPERCRV